MTAHKIKWGIIGPGGIARAFAGGIAHSRTGKLVAIATRDPGRAGLATDFPGARILNGYDALLADPEIEAVYIATPHPGHAEWAIKCAEAGKHVMCEKPMALSAAEADAIFNAARRHNTFMAEALMYRMHPQTIRMLALLRAGAIGEIRMIKSNFGFAMPKFLPEHRIYANDLAGGGILDVGVYPASMARLIAGIAEDKPFADPVEIKGTAHLGVTGVDEWASAVLRFASGIIAEISCSVSIEQDNVLRIFGTKGRIEIADFWFASGKQGGTGRIEIILGDGTRRTEEVREDGWLYAFEVDAACDAIRAGQRELASPGMTWDDTLGNMRLIDKWRKDAGLVYDIETPARRTLTLSGRKLSRSAKPMPHRTLPGLTKKASQVALGFEFFDTYADAAIMLDAFYEAGGNLLDTGYVYGGGLTEKLCGQWLTARGVRDETIIVAKGAHSPLTYPDVIAKQLAVSLDRLQTDYADVYFMHRDNIDIPVGEFVDAIDAEVRAGRIRGIFGGSNWTRTRLAEAIAYAKKTGKAVPSAMSNNFSLAEMINPIWAGCIAASDDTWKTWLKETQLVNFAWSSQGRGFFTDRAGRDKLTDPEIANTWYSPKNFERRDRAYELATKMGVSPTQIALAYVLAQPFPVVPLIGPRRLIELEDSLHALAITLTPADVKWLETGESK